MSNVDLEHNSWPLKQFICASKTIKLTFYPFHTLFTTCATLTRFIKFVRIIWQNMNMVSYTLT